MSQHIFACESNRGNVSVLCGWDNPLQWFFLVIDQEKTDEPLYSNLNESDPYSLTLDHFQMVLDSFGIKTVDLRPGTTGLYEKLQQDKLLKK